MKMCRDMWNEASLVPIKNFEKLHIFSMRNWILKQKLSDASKNIKEWIGHA